MVLSNFSFFIINVSSFGILYLLNLLAFSVFGILLVPVVFFPFNKLFLLINLFKKFLDCTFGFVSIGLFFRAVNDENVLFEFLGVILELKEEFNLLLPKILCLTLTLFKSTCFKYIFELVSL